MNAHDPLCDFADPRPGRDAWCDCPTILRVREDESERIAAAIEAVAFHAYELGPLAYLDAAGIARGRKGTDGASLPIHRTEAGWPRCSTCDGGGCPDCTDPA